MRCIFEMNGSRRDWSLHRSLGLAFRFRSSKTFTLNIARSPPLLNNNAGSSSASLYNPEDLSPFVGIDLWTPAASRKPIYNVAEWVRQNCIFFFSFFFQVFFFFPFIFISWRLITLQYCSGFCHTLTWISHGFTCVPHPHPLPRLTLHPIPLGLPSAPALSACLMHPYLTQDVKPQ